MLDLLHYFIERAGASAPRGPAVWWVVARGGRCDERCCFESGSLLEQWKRLFTEIRPHLANFTLGALGNASGKCTGQ